MAIGLYDKALNQPTAPPNWYKAPTELIAKAIKEKQLNYDLNRKGLDDLGVELDKADAIEGVDKDKMIQLRQEYAQVEDDIINKTDGDLSKADDYIRAYGERISKDFSATGVAGTITASKAVLDNIVKVASQMKAEGKITDAGYWYMINKEIEDYNNKGGHKANYDITGQYNTFKGKVIGDDRNVSDEAIKLADKWIADERYRPLSEMNSNDYVGEYKTKEGYVIYETKNGEKFVDREEVANALITNFMSDTGIKEQYNREYQYQKVNGSLNPLYNKSYDDIVSEKTSEISRLATKRNDTKLFLQSKPDRTELNSKYKELTGVDISNQTAVSDETIIAAINNLNDEQIKIEDNQRIALQEFIKEYETNGRSIDDYNFHSFLQDEIEGNIALAVEKTSFNEEKIERSVHADLAQNHLNALEIERIKARRAATKAAASGSTTTKTTLSNPSEATFSYETTNKIQEEYIKVVQESAKEHALTLGGNIRQWLAPTQGLSDADRELIISNFADVETLLPYLDEEGDLNLNQFMQDMSGTLNESAIKALKTHLPSINAQTRKLKQSKIEATRLIEHQKEKVWQASNALSKADKILVRGTYENPEKDFYPNYPYGEREASRVLDYYKMTRHKYTNLPDYIIAFNNLISKTIKWNNTKDEKFKKILNDEIVKESKDLGYNFYSASGVYDYHGKEREQYVAEQGGESVSSTAGINSTSPGSYSQSNLTSYGKKVDNYFSKLKTVKKELNKYINETMESYDDNVEYKMIFDDIPKSKEAIAKYNETRLLTSTITNLTGEKGLKDGMTVEKALNAKGLISSYIINSVKVSKDSYMGEQIFEVTYSGNNENKSLQYATVYLPRQTSLEILDDNKNAIIPRVSEVDANISSAKQNHVKLGNAGSSYIMDIANNRFYYHKLNKDAKPEIKIKYADGETIIVSYNTGVMAMIKAQEKAIIIDKLTDYSVNDNLSKPFTKTSTLSKADVISTFLTPYVDKASQGVDLSNDLESMIGGVLVVPADNKNVNDLEDLNPTVISSTEFNNNPSKYIKIKQFGDADIDLINKVFSQTKSKIPNLD